MNKVFKSLKGFFKKHFKLIIPAVLVLVAGLVIFKPFGSKKQQAQYQTATVEKGTIISTVSASGQILTANITNITSNASGLITKVYVHDGDKVTAGQKIMEIALDPDAKQNSASALSSYLSAKNSLASAQSSMYTLQSDLFNKWKTYTALAENSTYQNPDGSPRTDQRTLPEFMMAQDDWLASEAKYKNQQAVLTQSQASLNSAWLSYQASSPTVTAPVSGTVTNITYSEGMTLGSSQSSSTTTNSSGQRLAVIEAEGNPLATFNVSEIDVSRVAPGQKATITLDSLPDKTFTGKVVNVDRIGTVTSGVTNYPVVIQFDTKAAEILPNMSATANIISATKDNVLLIPSSAILNQSGVNVVRILKGNQEQTVSVETGLSSDTQTEITSGLSEGDQIITSTVTTSSSSSGGTSIFGTAGLRIGGGVGGGAGRPTGR